MIITQDDLCQLTYAIWESTLSLAVQPVPRADLPKREAGIVTGRVQITGAWQGAVVLQCSRELAKKVARAMFGHDSAEPSSEEVRDALAEITNVTAGNLKSLASGPCHLAMPEVTDHALDPPMASEEVVVSSQGFACQGELFLLTILEGQANHRAE